MYQPVPQAGLISKSERYNGRAVNPHTRSYQRQLQLLRTEPGTHPPMAKFNEARVHKFCHGREVGFAVRNVVQDNQNVKP